MSEPLRLGEALIGLRRSGKAVVGVAQRLVDDAIEEQDRVAALMTLAKVARSVAWCAEVAARDRVKPAITERMLLERLDAMEQEIERCRSLRSKTKDSATATK